MTTPDIIAALTPFMTTFGATLTADQWEQYGLALGDVNPGDLDEALDDLRKTHAFRNAPLPAEILKRCDVARKARTVAPASNLNELAPIQTGDGELRTFTLGGKSMTIRVLPDDHPALKRFACLACKDTGWLEMEQKTAMGNDQVTRCHCWKNNPVLAQGRERQAERARKRS